jgi:UDP-3-O-[3-hydroxymyristoyl] glucosamine N-acyltransferase
MSEPVFFPETPLALGRIANEIGATLRNPDSAAIVINTAAPIESAPYGSLTFIENPRYLRYAEQTRAAAVLCSQKNSERVPDHVNVLIHERPYSAYAKALQLLYPTAGRPSLATGEATVSRRANVSASAEFETDVVVEAGAVIGEGAAIGKGSHIHAGAVIGRNVRIGRNSTIGVNASIANALIGDRVLIHPGVCIGQDGFGFAMGPGGHKKIAQIGRVIVQDDVEIGANSTIDRGSNRDTVIGEGTKIDNLVQIGHNVVIGRHCIIVGMAGIAGSATLGDYVVVAGQAGIVGHIHIGDGAQIGGGAGVNFDVAPGAKLMGYPAMDVRSWTKINMILKSMVKKSVGPTKGEND